VLLRPGVVLSCLGLVDTGGNGWVEENQLFV